MNERFAGAGGHGPPEGDEQLGAEMRRRLLARRQVMLQGPLDDERANRVAAELMALEAEGWEPVTVYIQSDGGPLRAMFIVTDVIAAMNAPVDTCCLGRASGTAVAVLAAGTGTRRAGANARLMLQLPRSGLAGSPLDVERAMSAHERDTEQLFSLLYRATRQDREQIAEEWRRGRVLDAEEARREGFVDEVLHR